MVRNQFNYARSSLWVSIGAKVTCWLVHRKVNRLVPAQWFAIDQNLALVCIDLSPDLSNDFAVDLDSPLSQKLVYLSPGSETCCGQQFVNALLSRQKRRGCNANS
jgi:hypothetical protein